LTKLEVSFTPNLIMNTAQLRQQINHQLDQLSSDRLRLVADFIGYLAQKEQHQNTVSSGTQPATNYRPSSGKPLLSHTETWAGDDFEKCLQAVYETRSQLQP
jgi:hypothetical protein